MSKVTAPTPVADPTGVPAAGEGVPITADELVRRGMTMGGRSVAKVTVDFATGQVTCELEPETDHRADLRHRILRALRESPCPLTRKQLARVLGLKGVTGRFSPMVATLVATKEIFDQDGELTDSASKYSESDYS